MCNAVVRVMASSEEFDREMFASDGCEANSQGVPLDQLEPLNADDEETMQAVEDWHYWVDRGYEF